MKTLVVIPAFNAASTLRDLISGINAVLPTADFLVVDDGSTDDTTSLAESLGVECARLGKNLGKGAALRRGFEIAIEREYKRVITLDSDLQHDPAELPRFVVAAGESEKIIIGRRLLKPPMPWQRRLSNYLVSLMTSWAARQRIPDAQCGYRLIPVHVLNDIDLKSTHYESEMELLIKAGRAGYRTESIPIKTIYRDSRSSIRPFADTIRFLLLLIRSLFW